MTHDRHVIEAPDAKFKTSVPFPDAREQDVVPAAMSKHLNEKGFILTSADSLFDWARTGSMWPMTFGLACCAVEMIHSYMSRYDGAHIIMNPFMSYLAFCGILQLIMIHTAKFLHLSLFYIC